jgi:hypothetical protein
LALSTLLSVFLYRFLKERKKGKSTRGFLMMEREWGRMLRMKAGAVLSALDDPVLVISPGGWIIGRNQKAVEVCFGGNGAGGMNHGNQRMRSASGITVGSGIASVLGDDRGVGRGGIAVSRRRVHFSEVFEDGWRDRNEDNGTGGGHGEPRPSSSIGAQTSSDSTYPPRSFVTSPPNPNRAFNHFSSNLNASTASINDSDLTSSSLAWNNGWISRGTRNITVKRHDGTWFEAEATFSAVEESGASNESSDGSSSFYTSENTVRTGRDFHEGVFGSGQGVAYQQHQQQQQSSEEGMILEEGGRDRSGGGKMWVVIFRDVSARLAAERDLKLAKEAAERANQEKSEFLVRGFIFLCFQHK